MKKRFKIDFYGTQELADQMAISPNTMIDLLKIVMEKNYF